MKKKDLAAQPCPCDLGRPYALCCASYHTWQKNAPDISTLMRSRYSAYALNKIDYLVATWHPETVPREWDKTPEKIKWIDLKVHSSHTDINKKEGFVTFTARFRDATGKAHKMQETSRFIKHDQHWFYVEGTLGEKK